VDISGWGIPELRRDMLASASMAPAAVCAGGPMPESPTLFLWRTYRAALACNQVVAFYLNDDRLERCWRHLSRLTELLVHHQVAAVIEPDFSMWADEAKAVQLFNVYRTRFCGRFFQDAGIPVVPSLNWSTSESYEFAWLGIPPNPPVCALECRTAGGSDDDRRAFLKGLSAAVERVRPQNIVIYGGSEHSYWLRGLLPPGPEYTLLPSWTHLRDKARTRQARALRHKDQLQLFTRGEALCNTTV
jgi:Domain of unknown function (DUF4417)